MSRRDDVTFYLKLVWMAFLLAQCPHAHAAPRAGSYMQQSSSGYPLIVGGKVDTAKVEALAAFDDVVLNMVPWAQDVDGAPRADAPLMLRRLNPSIRLWLYVSLDPWLPQSFEPRPWDHSAYADMHRAVATGNGYLYDTQGRKWWDGLANISLNMGDAPTMLRLGDVLTRMVLVSRPDGIFLDNAQRTRAWASSGDHVLDVGRAGFRSLAAFDSASSDNLERLVARLHAASPCLLVAANCGPEPKPFGVDVDFREDYPRSFTLNDARRWMRTPGVHWLRADCWDSAGCEKAVVALKSAALGNPNAILSVGPGTGWPPVEVR